MTISRLFLSVGKIGLLLPYNVLAWVLRHLVGPTPLSIFDDEYGHYIGFDVPPNAQINGYSAPQELYYGLNYVKLHNYIDSIGYISFQEFGYADTFVHTNFRNSSPQNYYFWISL